MENGNIENAEYLLTCEWFCDSYELHKKIFTLVIQDKGFMLNVKHDNFESHINDILKTDIKIY